MLVTTLEKHYVTLRNKHGDVVMVVPDNVQYENLLVIVQTNSCKCVEDIW